MKFGDWQAAWDVPGGATPTEPLVWYDARDKTLSAGIRRHKRMVELERQLLLGLNPFARANASWSALLPLAGAILLLAIAFGWSGAITFGTMLLGATAAAYLVLRRMRKRHGRKLLRGEFGHAIMWDFEPAWELLTAELQPYNRTLLGMFGDRRFNPTPLLAKFLNETWVARGVLRQHGAAIPAGSESYAKVQLAAQQTAYSLALAIAHAHRDNA